MATFPSLNLTSVYDQLTNFANLSSFWNRFDSIFGTSYDKAIATTLLSQWQAKDFSQLPKIEIVSNTVLGNSRAAYGTSTNTIYVSDSFLKAATTTQSSINTVILEEIGHYIDAKVNTTDTKGDEGELFSNVVRGVSLSTSEKTRIRNENDWRQITLNGQTISVEASTPLVYETTRVFKAPRSSYNDYDSVSGINAVWSIRSVGSSNYVLNFFNGTTVAPIANSVYRDFGGTAISGNTIVYAKNQEIYRYSAGTTTRLTNNTFSDYDPQIDGTNIVWYAYDGSDVEIFRNNGTTTTQITNNASDEYDLKISGNNTTWVGWDGNDYEIYFNNGTSTIQITNNTIDDYNPVISGNKLAWRRWTGTTENLCYYDGTTTTQVVNSLNIRDFTISGDKIVYARDNGTSSSLHLYNGTAKTTTQLTAALSNSDFQIDGNLVVWSQEISNSNFNGLRLYNGTSTITLSDRLTGNFLLSGNKVAYIAAPGTDNFTNDSVTFLYDGISTTQVAENTIQDSYDEISGISGNDVLFVRSSSSSNSRDLYISRPSTKPALSITSNLTVVEGQTNPQNAVLTVTLSAASTTTVTVSYTTFSNMSSWPRAESGLDYTAISGTLTFAAGELTKNISVPILNNNESESDEDFFVQLSNPTGAVIIPGQGQGKVTITDKLTSSVTATLAGTNIENLTLTGTANINGTGNANNNVITGNSGSNILDGGGVTGFGSDTLKGGLGNDIYLVSDTNNSAIEENFNEGIDTVRYSSTNSFGGSSLQFINNVENLMLMGTGNFSGTGNSLNNVITGNSGDNVLDGREGNDTLTGAGGNDRLTGGLGSDKFDYRTLAHSLLTNFNCDVITDFNATAGNDLFLVTTARAGFTNAGVVTSLDATGIGAKLTATNFAANFAAQFTFGTRTFVAINDATAGFSATTDAVVEVTGLTGTLGLSNFVTA